MSAALHLNKPAIVDSNFASAVALPGELNETYASSLILAHSLHDVKIWRHPENQMCLTYCIIVRGALNQGHR